MSIFRRFFYGGCLRTGPQERSCFLRPYTVYNVKSKERQDGSGQIYNDDEARFVCRVVRAVEEEKKTNGAPQMGISVITFYSKYGGKQIFVLNTVNIVVGSYLCRQVKRIEDELRRDGLEGRAAVRTVDGFQGSESDIVVISCVRSDTRFFNKKNGGGKGGKGKIGFISHSERLNVALTRARFALFVVGSFGTFRGHEMWADFVKDARDRGAYVNIGDSSRTR